MVWGVACRGVAWCGRSAVVWCGRGNLLHEAWCGRSAVVWYDRVGCCMRLGVGAVLSFGAAGWVVA
eukprot:269487-Chlamydomonas_euryale.AAC.3